MKMRTLLITSLIALITTTTSPAFSANPCATVPNSKVQYDTATHKFKGCKLKSVAPDSFYARLGLKAGDVVTPNSSGMRKMELYNGTRSSEEQSVQ